jgi:hypothetical protein
MMIGRSPSATKLALEADRCIATPVVNRNSLLKLITKLMTNSKTDTISKSC